MPNKNKNNEQKNSQIIPTTPTPAEDTNPILAVEYKGEMNTLLDSLVTHSAHSASLDATIQRLEKEKRTAIASRDVLEARYIHGTLASIADLFQSEGVAYKDINSFLLSCMELTKDNWAFKASNGAPIGVSSIKNWKKCSDEDLSKTYEAVSKGAMFAKLNRFEAIKGRKFVQGPDGYAVLKMVVDQESKVVENPVLIKMNEDAKKADKVKEEQEQAKGDDAGYAKPAGILHGIATLLDQIEKSPFTLKDDDILGHLKMAQKKLMSECGGTPEVKELTIDSDI